MKIVFFGTPQFAVPSLQRLLAEPEIDVVAVVTQPDKPRGRGKQLIPSPVKKVAVEQQIPVWQPKRVKKHQKTLSLLREAAADAFVVVAYGQILSQEILDFPRLGCINGHASILPRYRGAAPIQWCLYDGAKETGMTTMLMDAGMDTGDMLLTAHTPISLLDNAHQLGATLANLGGDLLVETLFGLEKGEIKPLPQDNSQATYARLIQKSDYILDWSQPALNLHNQVRAFFPNCVTSLRGKNLKILATAPLGNDYWSDLPPQLQSLEQQWTEWDNLVGKPGEIVHLAKKLGPVVQTGQGLLLLTQVQLAGKRPQNGADFSNGMRLAVGEIIGS